LSILSVSAADPDGLPDPETLAALQNFPFLRTDRSGWVHVSTDGARMWVETER
jgi:beta-lactamase superfamily II metal-dependent hydrolase